MKTSRILPMGYVVKREPKTNRRSFALQQSILDELADIAEKEGRSINAIVNDVLSNYVIDYRRKR